MLVRTSKIKPMRHIAYSIAITVLLCLVLLLSKGYHLPGAANAGEFDGKIVRLVPNATSFLLESKQLGRLFLKIPKDTPIRRSSLWLDRPASISDFRYGQTIRFKTTGEMLESYPARAIATRIVIVADATGEVRDYPMKK